MSGTPLRKIGKYDVTDVNSYYPICLQPVDGDARLCNLLLTMLQRMDVETEIFADSLRTVSEIVA